MKIYVRLLQYLGQFLLKWGMFHTKVVEKLETHILCSVLCFRKSSRSCDYVRKYCTETTDENTAHAHCMLDIQGYRHTVRVCNTHCFSTAV